MRINEREKGFVTCVEKGGGENETDVPLTEKEITSALIGKPLEREERGQIEESGGRLKYLDEGKKKGCLGKKKNKVRVKEWCSFMCRQKKGIKGGECRGRGLSKREEVGEGFGGGSKADFA